MCINVLFINFVSAVKLKEVSTQICSQNVV